jgi:hypothetical protein
MRGELEHSVGMHHAAPTQENSNRRH